MKSQVISSRERKVTFMVFLMVAAFVGAWSGYGVLCILRLLDYDFTPLQIGISMLVAKTGACLNPVIFIFLNGQVRFRSIFRVFSAMYSLAEVPRYCAPSS